MAWITPIYNRTSSDVAYALLHQDSAEDLIGTLNISDLNRIESNCEYLHDELESHNIIVNVTSNGAWEQGDFVYTSDFDRIRQNVLNLSTSPFFLDTLAVARVTADLTNSYPDYTNINDIEQLLDNCNILIEYMIASFRWCGTFYSGEGYSL